MRIGILGTRGIPNHYGGFEQLAENLSVALHSKGHQVYVYSSSEHTYRQQEYKGVHIIHCVDPERFMGTIGQFIYDFNCILDSHKRNFDIILQLGYTSSSVWSFLFPSTPLIITNMDGLEWKREKYSPLVKGFLKRAERWAVNCSDALVSDSKSIQSYIKGKYNKESVYIPYGAYVFTEPDETIITSFGLEKQRYSLVIARLEKENNIEMIIKGYLHSGVQFPLIVIGSTNTNYGKFLVSTYQSIQIRFLNSIYDIHVLNNLRYYAQWYFHGHSVGGTNPSLLEAMASQVLICAHRNEFNLSVLGENAYYFMNEVELSEAIMSPILPDVKEKMISENIRNIKTQYSWTGVMEGYEDLMKRTVKQ